MSRLRTFIAVDTGKAIRVRAVALQENLARTGADVKWVEPENLHVTLLFLGEVDERTCATRLPVRQRLLCQHGCVSDEYRNGRMLSESAPAAHSVGRRRPGNAGTVYAARCPGAASS